MSPSVNQSSRAGFMNDTRISMQSSMLKTEGGGNNRFHNMNQSIGGASHVSASRNTNAVNMNAISNGFNSNAPMSVFSVDAKNSSS